MSSTGRAIVILLAYYILLFEELNTESKYLEEHFKFCKSDHGYDVFNTSLKVE